MLSFDGLLSQVYESGVGEAAEAAAEAEAEARAAREAKEAAARAARKAAKEAAQSAKDATEAELARAEEEHNELDFLRSPSKKVRIQDLPKKRRSQPEQLHPLAGFTRSPPPPVFSPNEQLQRRQARLPKSVSAPQLGRKKNAGLLAPMPSRPEISDSPSAIMPVPDWKPARRRKQLPGQLKPLHDKRKGTEAAAYVPPKLKGNGAWGGILQAQHQRLAGVIAKQQNEVAQMQKQLAVLQQINHLGGYVGEDPVVDDAVHQSMCKMAPQLGAKRPKWQQLSPSNSRSQSTSHSPTKQHTPGSAVGSVITSPLHEEDRSVKAALDHLEVLQDIDPRRLDAQLELAGEMEEEGASALAIQDDTEFADHQQPPVKTEQFQHPEQLEPEGQREEQPWEQEPNPQLGHSEPLHIAQLASTAPAQLQRDDGAPLQHPELASGNSENQEHLTWDESGDQRPIEERRVPMESRTESADTEVPKASQSFWAGEAQASLAMAASGGWPLPTNVSASKVEVWQSPPRRGVSSQQTSSSWLQQFEAAEASAVSFVSANATAQVLLANLDPNAPKVSYSTAEGSQGFLASSGPGASYLAGRLPGASKTDFLEQIGISEETESDSPSGVPPTGAKQLSEEGEEERGEGEPRPANEDVEPVEHEQLASAAEPEVAEPEVSSPERDEISATESSFKVRGKDWSCLQAECDALLAQCKRPASDDEEGAGVQAEDREGEEKQEGEEGMEEGEVSRPVAVAVAPVLSADMDLDLDM